MKLSILAALAIIIGMSTTALGGCPTSTCPTDDTQQAAGVSLARRIESAFKDLEIFNARAFKVGPKTMDTALEHRIENALKDLESATVRTLKADQERLNALERKTGIDR
jgi:hypothetical protein